MAAAPPPRILHLAASFDPGEPAAERIVLLVNALGKKADHAIVSDDRERRGAAHLISKGARLSWPRFPPLTGSKLPGRLMKLSAAMTGYDLICTWGAGALDAAFAHTLFADVHKLPPLVHHELDPEEIGGSRRGWYRRFALGRTAALVVPTSALETVALERWDQPRTRVRLIQDGIDTRAFAPNPRRDLLPGLMKHRDELWLGSFAQTLGDDPLALVRALAQMPVQWQLVIVGNPPERSPMEAEAVALAVEDRLHFAVAETDRTGLLALFDALALPDPDDMQRSLAIEAAAAGLPLVVPRGGTSESVLASENGALLFDAADWGAMAEVLRQGLLRADERRRIGQANRAKAREEFDAQRMIDKSWALYSGLAGRASTRRESAIG